MLQRFLGLTHNTYSLAMRCPILAATLTCCCFCLAQDGAKSIQPLRVARKVALVIGNSNYRHIPGIPPASADADDTAAALRSLGFQSVVVHKDLGKEQVIQAVSSFTRTQLQAGDLGVLYYSGHGGQVGEENFLLPVDYDPPADDELVEARAYRMSRLRDAMERSGARVRVLIFDACRNSPVTSTKSATGGLRPMEGKGEGTMIAYASAHNQAARFSGGERNSLYTAELLAALRSERTDLKALLERVQHRVYDRTGQSQTPYLYGFLSGPVYLGPTPAAGSGPVGEGFDSANEAYRAVKDSGNPELLDKFAAAFPNHPLASAARIKAEAQRAAATPATAGPKYVRIEPGSFMMGCSPGDNECFDEKPAQRQTISSAFYLQETEVTQAEYEKAMGNNPSRFKGANRPVEYVSWHEASAHCEKVGMRLPTAAEWEYAARAGTTGARYGAVESVAWYDERNSGRSTHEVKKKSPNAWGLYDMLGNVWEWTSTDYDSTSKELRGGSWDAPSRFSRASFRERNVPTYRRYDIGFRCAGDRIP